MWDIIPRKDKYKMLKTLLLSLMMVLFLICNKKIFNQNERINLAYWIISVIGILVYVIALVRIDTSISAFLTELVKPIVLWVFGGSFE